MTTESKAKQKIQSLIWTCSIVLMAGKFIAYYLTGSAAIFTDAMESIVNVAAGGISLYCIRLASRPRDKSLPFGHGKIEMISASMEGILIIMAGAIIIYEGADRLFSPSQLSRLDIGIYITAAAGLVNYLLGAWSIRAGRKHLSEALVAGGKHLQSDTYSTIGLVVGLVLVQVTGIVLIDSLMALIFGGIIIYTGISILRKTIATLTDKADPEKLSRIASILNRNRRPDWIDIHNLKILEYGSYSYIECDLTLPWYYTVSQGHDACEQLAETMKQESREKITFSVHADSCNEQHCQHCLLPECRYRRAPFKAEEPIDLHQMVESDEEYSDNERTKIS